MISILSLTCLILTLAICSASNGRSSRGLQKQIDEFCSRAATPKKNCDDDSGEGRRKVVFLAWYSKPNTKLGDHEAVKFDKVIDNIGNGYKPSTGKFTAPVSGIYSISVSVMSEPSNSMHLEIMKNAKRLTVLFVNSKTYPQASNTLNLSLKKGDTIWVKRLTGRILHAHATGQYNVFSGVLIS